MVQTGLNSRGGCESRLLEREVVLLWRHLPGGEEPAVRAQKIVPIVTVQNHYNLADRRSERMDEAQSEQMIDICARQGIGFIPWSPLTAGQLARGGGPLDQIARQHNARPSQIALAWLLKRSPTMLPIPGTSSVQHLEEDVQGATIQLTQEEFDTIERAAAGQ